KPFLTQTPKQPQTTKQFKSLLSLQSPPIIFTTIQKFQPQANQTTIPPLTQPKNLILIPHHPHPTQYPFNPKYHH
ncbi:hypothetical protein, partial [Staphylococcus capitis]|uniref:hypothetical protein n=1 Tax=Staphylococcus capitis TaxID=29388 RepID=UPI001642BE68